MHMFLEVFNSIACWMYIGLSRSVSSTLDLVEITDHGLVKRAINLASIIAISIDIKEHAYVTM